MALKRALVLSGGGSRGSYEIGVWEALEEVGLRFHMCFGTSIGAINAAMFLQGDRALAARLWEDIPSRGVLRADGEQAAQVERMFGRKREVLPFLLEHARQMRLDLAPLEALLREHLDEGRARASGMDFGLVAMKFPSLAPAFRTLADIQQGRLVDWVLASAACFPIFPTRVIDGERYVVTCNIQTEVGDAGALETCTVTVSSDEKMVTEMQTACYRPERSAP